MNIHACVYIFCCDTPRANVGDATDTETGTYICIKCVYIFVYVYILYVYVLLTRLERTSANNTDMEPGMYTFMTCKCSYVYTYMHLYVCIYVCVYIYPVTCLERMLECS